jgi:hypothetical protein
MIQRIQTVYLLLVLAISCMLFFAPSYFPFYHFWGKLPLLNLFIETDCLIPIDGVICLVCIAAIFTFKRRKVQKNICRALILLELVYLGAGFVYVMQHVMQHGAKIDFHLFGLGVVLPVISIIFIVLAVYRINKDEELIRSMDRLR